MSDDRALFHLLLRRGDRGFTFAIPSVVEIFHSRTSLCGELFVELCCVRSLMHHVACGTWLRAIKIWCTGNFLSWSWHVSIGQLPRVFDFDGSHGWVTLAFSMRMARALHCLRVVNDVLRVTVCSWIDGIVRVFKSCSGFPCFCSSRALVACHIFLGKSLLDRFAFPVIVSNTSSTLNHPSTKLPEH